MREFARVDKSQVAEMAANMIADPQIEETWMGDTRMHREFDGTITEWRVVGVHVNGRRFKAEIT